MVRRILWALGIFAGLVLALVAFGPFLIGRDPAPGVPSPRELALPESRFVTVPWSGTPGIEIHYLEKGPPEVGPDAGAPVFVLLHGFTLNAFGWEPVLNHFARRGRVVAYDQIPYGLSAKPVRGDWEAGNPYDRGGALERLFAVMDGLGIARATLVGSSSGGTLALDAALARPERVQALILSAPWVYAQRPTLPRWLADLPQMDRIALFGARKLGESTLLGLSYLDPEAIGTQRRERALIHTGAARWDLAWGELLWRSLGIPVDVGERLAYVTQPTLVIAGAGDGLVDPEDSRRVAETIGTATGNRAGFRLLPDCGHLPQEECPQAFMQAVEGWLDGLGEGRTGAAAPR